MNEDEIEASKKKAYDLYGEQVHSVARLKFLPVEPRVDCIMDDEGHPKAHTVDFNKVPNTVYAVQHKNGFVSFYFVNNQGGMYPLGRTIEPIPLDFGTLIYAPDYDDVETEGKIE